MEVAVAGSPPERVECCPELKISDVRNARPLPRVAVDDAPTPRPGRQAYSRPSLRTKGQTQIKPNVGAVLLGNAKILVDQLDLLSGVIRFVEEELRLQTPSPARAARL
jgi:hypothetical protein